MLGKSLVESGWIIHESQQVSRQRGGSRSVFVQQPICSQGQHGVIGQLPPLRFGVGREESIPDSLGDFIPVPCINVEDLQDLG